jgi:uncharacterized protein
MGMPETRSGEVEVVYALPERQRVVRVPLPPSGLTAGEAVQRSGLLEDFPQLAGHAFVLGIYGALCGLEHPLRAGDRVEIYRPLRNDPKTLRRARAAKASRNGRK